MILSRVNKPGRLSAVLFAALFFLLPGALLYSYGWPVDEPVVISSFGEDKWGSFSRGMEIYGSGSEVSPSAAGEVIFYNDNDSSPGKLPSGMGSFAVIEHERKLRTLYGSLELADDFENVTLVEEGDSIGLAGMTGKSFKPHIFFAVIDSEFGQYVNPLLLLNSIVDNLAPVIREVGINTPAGFKPVGRTAQFPAGRVEVRAEIFDPCMSGDFFCSMAPYKIYLFLNGQEIFYAGFDSMVTENGRQVIQSTPELFYEEYYKPDGKISLGQINLVPGESRFEILVSDYAGNETSRSFTIRVVE